MGNFFNFQAKKKLFIAVRQPDVEMSIVTRLGKPKFWISNSDFFETMEKMYKKASSSALEHYYGQISSEEKSSEEKNT